MIFLATLIGLVLYSLACTPKAAPTSGTGALPPPADKLAPSQAEPGWQVKWEKTLSEARREGKLVIFAGGSVQEGQYAMQKALNDRYKINLDLEWNTGRSSDIMFRLFAERRAGLYTADVTFKGNTTTVNEFKPAKILDYLEPQLLLPEVLDPKAWWEGGLPWVDKDKMILAMSASPELPISINTKLVKEEEIKSYLDLLNPKWKGKIVMDDPTVGGAANSWFMSANSKVMGSDFMRKMAGMDITIIRNKRLEVEWLAQGKYPVGIGLESALLLQFIKEGAPIKLITPKEGTYLTSSSSNLALIDKAPHPNAARVFINWLLTREGQTIYQNATGNHSARVDVPTDNIHPLRVRQAGVKYFNTIDEEYLQTGPEQTRMAQEIFGPMLK